MSLAVKVVNFRKGPFGNALAFFSVLVGTMNGEDFVPALVLREHVLKEKKDKTSYFYQAPAKARLDKDKKPVMENGFAKYDPYVDFYFEGKGEEAKMSKASWAVRTAILDQAVALYEDEDSGDEGRGAAKPPKQDKQDKPKSGKPKAAKPPADEEDDDLPF